MPICFESCCWWKYDQLKCDFVSFLIDFKNDSTVDIINKSRRGPGVQLLYKCLVFLFTNDCSKSRSVRSIRQHCWHRQKIEKAAWGSMVVWFFLFFYKWLLHKQISPFTKSNSTVQYVEPIYNGKLKVFQMSVFTLLH